MAKAIDIGKFVVRFVEEARDHIGKLNEGLAALEGGHADKETVNAIFRSAHTIKGSSRMLKLGPITDTAHKLEDVLGALRDGSVSFDATLAQVLYRGVDGLAALVDKLAENNDGASLPPADAALLAVLAAAAVKGEAQGEALGEQQASTAAPVPSEPPVVDSAAETASVPSATDPKPKTPDTVRVRLTKLDELIKLMGEVVSSHARMRQRLADIRVIEREVGDGSELSEGAQLRQRLHGFAQTLKEDVLAQEALMDELHDKALIMRMLPLAIVFEPAGRMIREMARTVGKQVECVVSGGEIELDRQMIDRLSDPVIHLLRNAVDHGLETPEHRVVAGKPPQGRLSLKAHQDGGWVVVEVADDGGGISIEAVRDKAIKKGVVAAEKAAALSDQEIVDFIFLPGFSTSSIITDLSGRGVGMDVVKQTIVDDLQGVVGVETRPGVGTTFSLRLPLSLAVMRVVLVEVDGLPFGFTAQYVAEILRVPRSAMLTVAERNAVVVRNEFVPVVPLSELLNVPKSQARKAGAGRADLGLLLVVVRVRNEKVALEVDELIDERDMVIKPLPEHMRQVQMVSGMVITGRNELVSVLHAPALLEQARKVWGQAPAASAEQGAASGGYRVLVVDDSLNTREIEKDVLEAHGYRVTLAEDGLDGLRKAQAERFDAVLTDVEMPHMDGFSLTERLRQEEGYRTTPIVIITSREKEEDKRRGVQVGADAYIVKGDFDQSNLVDTLRALLG